MISSVGSSSYASQLVSSLYSKLDSNNQGYFQLSDLQSALGTSSDDSSGSAVEDLFGQLDGNSDGKVTQNELTSGLQQLASQLNSAYDQMRMGGSSGGMPPPPDGAQGMPPPPPPPNGSSSSDGFTQDELQSQLDSIGGTDSKRSSLISSIIQNFDQADANGDGKVSADEAMSFDKANSVSASGSASNGGGTDSSSSDSSASSSSSDSAMNMIMQLLRAYGQNDQNQTSLFSASA